jgi:hypothetical protein
MGIKKDDHNYRIHNDKNLKLIEKSIDELGYGRSILIDSEDKIIGGNGVFDVAEKKNVKTKIIDSDGSELIVVRRVDLKPSDKKRKKLALADNSTNDTSSFDLAVLQEEFEVPELQDYGIDIFIDNELEDFSDDTDSNGKVNKELIMCPSCGHINEKKAFQKYDQNTQNT